ncbi:MAG: iron-sulfur cluster assembly scaffold protein, partial [Planctomycetota bacterium]
MHDLAELYQQLILDHNKSPRNRRRPEAPTQTAEGYNPLCGDRITLFVTLKDDVIEDIAFQGSGCA